MSDDKELILFLCSVEGMGLKTLQSLYSKRIDWEELYEMTEGQAKLLLGERLAQKFIAAHKTRNPQNMWRELKQKQIDFYSFWDEQYPEKLRRIPDPPKGIYVRGKLPSQDEKCVAIIGARACSQYGRVIARELGAKLGRNKVSVVSGMARGIDSYGQWSALEAGGRSYAVLGCGVDVCYPPESRKLFELLIKRGGVVSEYPPGTEAKANLFPPRNRIISALSQLVVVVEAKVKSGTLITVDMALEQGKEVMAVPGRTGDVLSEGCNRLIMQGATPLLDGKQILDMLGIEEDSLETTQRKKMCEVLRGLDETSQRVYEILDDYPQNIDLLARELLNRRCLTDYGGLYKSLLTLCEAGLAKKESMGCYSRIQVDFGDGILRGKGEKE